MALGHMFWKILLVIPSSCTGKSPISRFNQITHFWIIENHTFVYDFISTQCYSPLFDCRRSCQCWIPIKISGVNMSSSCFILCRSWNPPVEKVKSCSFTHGDGSKPWYLVNPKIAGKWMFIPLKMYL